MFDDLHRQARLEARLHAYHEVSLRRVLDELAYLREPGDQVLAGGSLAYDLGNPLSDLDIIMLGPSPKDSSRLPLEHFVASLRVDVWRLSHDALTRTFGRARKALESSASLRGSFGDIDDDFDLKLLTHTAFGVSLDGDDLGVAGPERRELASRLVMREFVERMRTSALLAQLALRGGSDISAIAHARLAVEEALVAMLAHRGLPFCGDKWIREFASGHPDLASLYRPFCELPRDPARAAAEFVRRALESSTRMWGLELTLETLAPMGFWKHSDLELATVGDERLLISRGAGALWRLEQGEVEAWRRLTTDSDQDAAAASWFPTSTDDELLRFCNSLYEAGLLELGWETGVRIEELAPMRGGSI